MTVQVLIAFMHAYYPIWDVLWHSGPLQLEYRSKPDPGHKSSTTCGQELWLEKLLFVLF